jgi:hypothetical protein
LPARADGELIQSRISLELVQRREDLYNPRIIGRLRGVPSAAAIATGQAAEIWATIEEEPAHTAAAPFQFLKSNEL